MKNRKVEKRIVKKKQIKRKKIRLNKLFVVPFFILVMGFIIGTYFYSNLTEQANVVKKYYELLSEKSYDEMYELVQTDLSREDFMQRVKNIYEGIEAKDISIHISSNVIIKDENDGTNSVIYTDEDEELNESVDINYKLSMNTLAGEIEFKNRTPVIKNGNDYKIQWSSSMIFPGLKDDEKVRVRTLVSKRGEIFDRNGKAIAKQSSIYEIGIVPGKLNSKDDIRQIAELLDISAKDIENKIDNYDSGSESFVSLKKISKEEQQLKNELLKIKGIIINDIEARTYPYKDSMAIMTGYVQDRDGITGVEYSCNSKLKGEDGVEIYIEKDGKIKESLVSKEERNGEDIKLTIDAELQQKIYDEFKQDKSAVVAINYNTGEIKALVSTPSFDPNKFIVGISENEWEDLKNDEQKPLFNRYLTTYAPGSTIKPLIGAIGLATNSFSENDDFGKSGKRWQKDSSWGDFWITTLKEYSEPADLKNALINSDNIYFAKAGLKIGKTNLKEWFHKFGFESEMDFLQKVEKSSYGKLDNDKAIAGSSFGQAQVMVNPILMASVYSCFANHGKMVQPYLEYESDEAKRVKVKDDSVLPENTANTIKEFLTDTIEKGSAQIEGRQLAGKTGTAEIKKDQNDHDGTENGWLDIFDNNGNLYVCMVEDVKNRGGSQYVVEKLENLLLQNIID